MVARPAAALHRFAANGYEVPKIYLHDLHGRHPTRVYALVDGKQRVTTIRRFLRDVFPLSPRFKVEEANRPPELPPGTPPPLAGMRFSEMDPAWREVLERTYLSVVLIQNATEEDIEDLFSRLNNGEPLNAAERRNTRGGDMARLVREVAKRPFFTERLRFSNARYRHLDLAARLLLIERSLGEGDGAVPDPEAGAGPLRRGQPAARGCRARPPARAGRPRARLHGARLHQGRPATGEPVRAAALLPFRQALRARRGGGGGTGVHRSNGVAAAVPRQSPPSRSLHSPA